MIPSRRAKRAGGILPLLALHEGKICRGTLVNPSPRAKRAGKSMALETQRILNLLKKFGKFGTAGQPRT